MQLQPTPWTPGTFALRGTDSGFVQDLKNGIERKLQNAARKRARLSAKPSIGCDWAKRGWTGVLHSSRHTDKLSKFLTWEAVLQQEGVFKWLVPGPQRTLFHRQRWLSVPVCTGLPQRQASCPPWPLPREGAIEKRGGILPAARTGQTFVLRRV